MRAGRIGTVHCYGRFAVDAVSRAGAVLGDREVVACRTPESFLAELDRVEAVLGLGMRVPDWSVARRLRLIHLVGSGADSILPAAGLSPDVRVAAAKGLSAPAMAEFAVAMLLALAKRLPEVLASQRSRAWEPHHPVVLSGGALLVAGAGPVGREVARRAKALGMDVIGVRNGPDPVPEFDETHPAGRFAELAGRADAIVLAVPATPLTRHLLDGKVLDRCRPSCLIVNVSRGEVVDERELAARLRAGSIGGAALDVFEKEPLPPVSPLWDAPGAILTPHVSWSSPGYGRQVVELFARNLERVERGEPVVNPVDLARGY
ncbi:D-2-hydroxyacid dehydrogenase [Nonomuraea harbinensis]|uniref:D-2-hydroxyacid dehydrogenase n=1 Tax=Nonomuraea harbinensis TaxID=1286938 RepID=A0ABW1BMD1_9ACTN|nr:D-2-hydroxyacid dehydrogenase [Nonomuraea harbinensis]